MDRDWVTNLCQDTGFGRRRTWARERTRARERTGQTTNLGREADLGRRTEKASAADRVVPRGGDLGHLDPDYAPAQRQGYRFAKTRA